MQSDKCQIEGEGKSSLGLLATVLLTAWDVIGFLCCKGVFLTHVQLSIHQDPQLLFCRAAFQSVHSYIVARSYYILDERLHLLLLNLKVLVIAFFQPPQVPLSSIPALQCIDHSPYLWSSTHLLRMPSVQLSRLLMKTLKRSLKEAICYWLPAGLCAWHFEPGGPDNFQCTLLSTYVAATSPIWG